MLRIDDAAHSPERFRLVFDPDPDALVVAFVVEPDDGALGEAARFVIRKHGSRIAPSGPSPQLHLATVTASLRDLDNRCRGRQVPSGNAVRFEDGDVVVRLAARDLVGDELM